ncbi:protein of unknown function [Taphrina deformans PYCC 5710]|uniref:Uncharacterized protein n=1 Tax=Taphrina deformans (strain PYCC 5710 / ATCC 11124 / CBS 356.35 / IMI 108563 / JCM 9778 / NBRC 8474) TaxID=1097556 RepID=R4XF10_TAPDE|nr:protein of unknown function [Taphrina deformans PYCC 5710]|eukprot:CCG84223.1 protein of unknown function [Taphrina deformans PYCC 5710]
MIGSLTIEPQSSQGQAGNLKSQLTQALAHARSMDKSIDLDQGKFCKMIAILLASITSDLEIYTTMVMSLSSAVRDNALHEVLGYSSHANWVKSLDDSVKSLLDLGSKQMGALVQCAVNMYVCWGLESLSAVFHNVPQGLALADIKDFVEAAPKIKLLSNVTAKLARAAKNVALEAYVMGLSLFAAQTNVNNLPVDNTYPYSQTLPQPKIGNPAI